MSKAEPIDAKESEKKGIEKSANKIMSCVSGKCMVYNYKYKP